MSAPKPWERISNELVRPSEGISRDLTLPELISQTKGIAQTGQAVTDLTQPPLAPSTAQTSPESIVPQASMLPSTVPASAGIGFQNADPYGQSYGYGGYGSSYPYGASRPGMYGGGIGVGAGGYYGGAGFIGGGGINVLDRISQYVYSLCDIARMLEGNAQGLVSFFNMFSSLLRKIVEGSRDSVSAAYQYARKQMEKIKGKVVGTVVRYLVETDLPEEELARQVYVLGKVKLALFVVFCIILLRYLLALI